MRRFVRERSVWALGLSLLLHACLVLFLVLRPEAQRAKDDGSHAIELEIVQLEPPPEVPKPPEPEPVKPPEPEPPKPVEPPKKNAKVAEGKAKKQTAEFVAQPSNEPEQKGSSGASGSPAASAADAPKSAKLMPSAEFEVAHGSAGIDVEPARGHTIRNSPDERPDPVAMAEYNSEKLGRRTSTMVEGMVADTQAKNGLVHPYFMDARRSMEEDMSAGQVPLGRGVSAAREAVKGFIKTQENFGKTGNPFAPGESPKWDDYSLARNENQGMAMQARDPTWAGINRAAEQSMAAQEATARVMDHAWVEAILELIQEPGGGISDAHIVKSSGSKEFDEYVLHRARKTFLKMDDPPDEGHGISSAGWRTLWKFSYWPVSIAEKRGQRVRVELLRVTKGQGSGNPLEHVAP